MVVLGSVVICFHLGAVGIHVLSPRSGPWVLPPPYFSGVADGPKFTEAASRVIFKNYLHPLRSTHDYHFLTNNTLVAGVKFEVRLLNDKGEMMRTLTFPDTAANFWVRHRQQLLAQGLIQDFPVQRVSEQSLPKGQRQPRLQVWETGPDQVRKLVFISQTQIDPSRHPGRPSEWTQLLVRSYLRHLCREHSAARAELIRIMREPVMVEWMFGTPPAGAFEEIVSSFGELRSEK
jgi:hypothetical protein